MKKILSVFAACALSFTAWTASAADRDITNVTICAVQVGKYSAVIQLCGSPYISRVNNTNGYIAIPLSTAGERLMYASAMEAMINDKPVLIRIDINNTASYYDTATMVRVYH